MQEVRLSIAYRSLTGADHGILHTRPVLQARVQLFFVRTPVYGIESILVKVDFFSGDCHWESYGAYDIPGSFLFVPVGAHLPECYFHHDICSIVRVYLL